MSERRIAAIASIAVFAGCATEKVPATPAPASSETAAQDAPAAPVATAAATVAPAPSAHPATDVGPRSDEPAAPASPPPTPMPPPKAPGVDNGMPEDCEDICNVGVRCDLGHVKERDACATWCDTDAEMGAYACMALHAQDCDEMKACWRKERSKPKPARRKGEEGKMGAPAR